jgi:anti-sigma B factor antagonist
MLGDVRFEPFPEGVVARLTGEIDMSNADELGAALKQMVSNQALGLVLDLSDVDYFDSAGIHLIYDLRESLSMRGQQLRLVVPHDSAAHDSLRLAAVLQTLDVDRSVDDAIAAVS